MKNKKSIVLAAVSAVAFASISVGTTFALFTSKAETNIEVSSGKINVNANLDDIKVYSAVFESETVYHEELQNETRVESGLTQHLFSNGGYAAYDATNSLFIIDRITPGDLVKFSFNVASDSNVKFKYRLSYVAVDTDENPDTSYLDLVKGMDTTIKSGDSSVSYRGLAKYQTEWEIKDPAEELDDVEFTLSLPVEAGNQYQNKDAKILVSFEAVQANAYTAEDSEVVLVEEDIISNPAIAAQGVDTVVTAQSSVSDLSFKVTVPANATYEGGSVDPEEELTIEVTDLGKTEEVYSTETSLNFDLVVKVNGVEANGFTAPLPVQIYVGKGLIISSVKHNNEDVSEYVYDTDTGYISFSTSSFSPFEVSFLEGVEVYTAAKLIEVLPNGGKIGIKDNITVNQYLSVKKDTTIIGLGHTITVNASRGIRVEENDVVLNVNNLNLVGGSSPKCERGIQVDGGKTNVTINLDNVDVTNITYYSVNVCSNATVNLNIDNCDIEGWGAINLWSNGYVVNITNSRLVGLNDKSYNADGWNDFGVVILEGDTTGATDAHASNNIVKISNTEIVAETTKGNTQYFLLFNKEDANNTVILNNVTLTDVATHGETEFVLGDGNSNVVTGDYYRGGEHVIL